MTLRWRYFWRKSNQNVGVATRPHPNAAQCVECYVCYKSRKFQPSPKFLAIFASISPPASLRLTLALCLLSADYAIIIRGKYFPEPLSVGATFGRLQRDVRRPSSLGRLPLRRPFAHSRHLRCRTWQTATGCPEAIPYAADLTQYPVGGGFPVPLPVRFPSHNPRRGRRPDAPPNISQLQLCHKASLFCNPTHHFIDNSPFLGVS